MVLPFSHNLGFSDCYSSILAKIHSMPACVCVCVCSLLSRVQRYVTSFQMFNLDLEKAEGPEIKLPTSIGSLKKQENSRKTSTSALLTTPKPLTVDRNKMWKILKEMGIPDHLNCLLRTLYAGREARDRTWTWNKRLFQNWERSTLRLYIVTLLI